MTRTCRLFSRAADCQSVTQQAASLRYDLARTGSWSKCASDFGGRNFPWRQAGLRPGSMQANTCQLAGSETGAPTAWFKSPECGRGPQKVHSGHFLREKEKSLLHIEKQARLELLRCLVGLRQI